MSGGLSMIYEVKLANVVEAEILISIPGSDPEFGAQGIATKCQKMINVI